MILGAQTISLGEIAEALAEHKGRTCAASLDHLDGDITLTVRIAGSAWEPYGLQALELAQVLQRLVDMGQLRALGTKYNIPAHALEALVGKERKL